ncbi:dihydrofolate reductase [Apiospora phragmitis]|uniref:Dihydrofolate reductase n=1 Tax=Apiospora phragmitis TaxID=2905665 RepID=A0ABR1TRZ0_9PEZI
MSAGTTTADTMLPVELTLVVAATRDMGIGRAGTLPWTGLKKEMAYFARVTKRLPADAQPPAMNAVIMGRKTWDSIPVKFRPLKGRLNIVISRSHPENTAADLDVEKEPVKVGSLAQALEYLKTHTPAGTGAAATKAFVIGGAQIYGASLALPEARRVLLTRVMDDFDCDTFFPLRLPSEEGEGKWAQRSKEELDAWTGETVTEGVQEENGTRYEFQMWERVD